MGVRENRGGLVYLCDTCGVVEVKYMRVCVLGCV